MFSSKNMNDAVQILPVERWIELEKIFETEFGAVLPDTDKATILFTEDENGNIRTFAVVETLLRIGQIHTIGNGTLITHPRKILRYVCENVPPGASVVALDDNGRFGGLAEHFGMRHIPGKFYRRDF